MRSEISQNNTTDRSKTLFRGTVLSGIGLIMVIIFLMFNVLNVVKNKTNALDSIRERESVQAALNTAEARMNAIAYDNAAWDDAYFTTYQATPDVEWLETTWGFMTEDAVEYDSIFIIDENLNTVWAQQYGKDITHRDMTYLGEAAKQIILTVNRSVTQGKAQSPNSGFVKTEEGPALLSVQLIRPITAAPDTKSTALRYIVLVKHLTPTILEGFANTFDISNLKLIRGNFTSPSTSHLVLTAVNGETLGTLYWTPRIPGVMAAQATQPEVIKTLIFVCGVIGLFVMMFGLTLRKLSASEMTSRKAALTDSLSQLPNRRALVERLESIHRNFAEDNHKHSMAFIDLDGFKDINDTYGHGTGDKVITIVAGAFQNLLPEGALLARLGGDEFAVLLEGKRSLSQMQSFARKVLKYFNDPVIVGDRTIKVGASVGITSALAHETNAEEMFRRADVAMYHAKSEGKGRIKIFDNKLDEERLAKQAIEEGLRRGIANNEFEVFYQPIYDSHKRVMVGVEALMRWTRRPEGMIGPDVFIPIAESSGLIHPLGQFVLRRACEDLKDLSDLKLSVNVSPAQFRDPNFEKKVVKILEDTGFPSDRLEIEVTEGYLIEYPERANAAIAALRKIGASISLDDFGTGYSSIGYLQKYGFDKIKIDKSLAGQVDTDKTAAALVQGTVAIARALNMTVTAEGVETEDQALLLKLAGCQYLQGYLFAKPKPSNALREQYEAETQSRERAKAA